MNKLKVMAVTEKPCGHCKENKQASEFCKDKSSKTGLHSWCRQCQKKYAEDPKIKAADLKRRQNRGFVIHKNGKKFTLKHNTKILGTYSSKDICERVMAKYKARQTRRKMKDQRASHDDYWDTL